MKNKSKWGTFMHVICHSNEKKRYDVFLKIIFLVSTKKHCWMKKQNMYLPF